MVWLQKKTAHLNIECPLNT